jgi:cation transport ATPase
MKTRFLFPYWCRYLGWLLIIIHIPVMVLKKIEVGNTYKGYNTGVNTGLFSPDHLFFIATAVFMAIGLFLVAFSKEKIEDEQISQLRLDSLQWAIYFNYLLLIITLILSKDGAHILFLNMLIPLAFFIIRFRWKIFQNNRLLKSEVPDEK